MNQTIPPLPQIAARTLVLRGELDPTVPQAAAVAMTHLLVHGELRVIEREPHCVHYTSPAQVWDAIQQHAAFTPPPVIMSPTLRPGASP